MKLKAYLPTLLLLALVNVSVVRAAAGPTFPEIGKKYQVEYIALSLVDDKPVYYALSIPNGAVIKVLEHAEGTWCLVEYLRFAGTDEKTKKSRFKKEQFWLNFSNLVIVRAATEAQTALPPDAIVE